MKADVLVRARAPLRLGLAGGGTDVSPYCDLHGGYVLNATIDRYAYAVITPRHDRLARFEATDLARVDEMPLEGDTASGAELDLHRAVYRRMMQDFNQGRLLALTLSTFCDAPAGSGLGSSSTLVVAMVRAFVELLNLPLDDYTVAQLAYQIERVDCGLQGGRQDQYAATFGGFNFMEFYDRGRTLVNPLRIKQDIVCELEASLLLFFTGVSRASAGIIADQVNNVSSGALDAIEAMHGIKREAVAMKECLLRGDFDGLVQSMRTGWASKKQSARSVSNPYIEEVYQAAADSGALAGKVSGAGGGGFMMFFVSPARRMEVVRTLQGFAGQVSNCHFTSNGTQAWKV
jgi:D-glycero-alpha-D-manno-heptose-7-phosphate kinase